MYKFVIPFFVLVSTSAHAMEFKDTPAGELVPIKRSFKVKLEDCKDKWEVSAESNSSYCTVNAHALRVYESQDPIMDSDELTYNCSAANEKSVGGDKDKEAENKEDKNKEDRANDGDKDKQARSEGSRPDAKSEEAKSSNKVDGSKSEDKSDESKGDEKEIKFYAHGTFGYLISVEGQIPFDSVKSCIAEKIKKLPHQEISVVFLKLKAKK